jgi:putative transposase
MLDYRRAYQPGGAFFFALVAIDRRPILTTSLVNDILRQTFVRIQKHLPFSLEAVVVLLDNLHCLWTLPDGDTDFFMNTFVAVV